MKALNDNPNKPEGGRDHDDPGRPGNRTGGGGHDRRPGLGPDSPRRQHRRRQRRRRQRQTTPTSATYDDPQPCGPGAGAAFMQEPHEIKTGHYALFDAYWRTIKKGVQAKGVQAEDVPGVGVLHTNLCPPLAMVDD